MNSTTHGSVRRVAGVRRLARGAELALFDARGSIMVEYAVLVGTMALAGALGLVAVGISVVRSFDFVRELLLCPIP